jgi:alpha-ribazole phosphatase/probable phosphoglycerate mutase
MNRANPQTSPARCTLILVRHAHTDMAGRFCGHSDPPLSSEGLAQLSDLNLRLNTCSFTHIFSSDLQRACQTAESIAKRGDLQVHQLISLRELAFGSWEGLDWDQIMARDPEYAQRWLDLYPSVPAPGGETFEDFRKRILSAMNAIAAQVQGSCAVVVTHAGVIRTFLSDIARLRDNPADFSKYDYASCWKLWCEEGKWGLSEGTIAALCVK